MSNTRTTQSQLAKSKQMNKFFSICLVLLGAGLEYYNYMLFALMIPIITPIFNGTQNSLSALTSGYLIIFVSALMRPLGGVLIGYLGDKKGRSVALFWAMMLMAASSFAIAFLPSYAQIGVYASVLLLICRMMQTMSAASELNGSAIFLIETLEGSRKRDTKGLASGLAWSFTVLGMLGGSVASYYSDLSNWRTPFLLGGVIGLFAIILRMLPKVEHGSGPAKPRKNFNFLKSSVASILIASGLSGMFYYNMIWMIGNLQYKLDPMIVKKYSMLYFLIYAIALLASGILSDYLKKMYRFMFAAICCLAVLGAPTLHMFINQNFLFHIINVVLLACYVGPSHAVLTQLFPKEYRYRGVSITYSIGTSLIGGITPFMCNKLSIAGHYYPAFWLVFVVSLAFGGVFLGKNSLVSQD